MPLEPTDHPTTDDPTTDPTTDDPTSADAAIARDVDITTTRLPGAGTRMDLADEDGHALTVISLRDGGCELFVPSSGAESLRLTPAATRALGLALAGHVRMTPAVIERLDGVLGGLAIDAVRLPKGSPLAERTIAQLALRQRTGVTVAAVLRGSLPVVAPEPTETLHAGDELVVIGRVTDVDAFTDAVAAGGG